MALALIQVVNWHTKRPEKYVSTAGDHAEYALAWGDYYLLNTNRMSELKVINTDNTQFLFTQDPNDRRCSPDTIETTNTISEIADYHDLTPDSKFATLPIYPTLDITRVAVDTPVDTLVEWDNICMAYQTPRDLTLGVCHLVYYKESWRRKTVIVEFATLLAILLEQVANPT